ncbi:MAG: 4Fe-4S dicluster domain-containing protein [Bacillus sp. (in: Bacteria)]|nr:4Fe-4S dicluster domain-containing protein [Bacillus sp. (in: firmicutes)]
MGQLGFYYDLTKCIGCKTCQVSCKDKNNLKVGPLFRRVHDFEGGTYPKPYIDHLTISCNHCDRPLCVQACPVGAMHKRDDGVVNYDWRKCIGCQACVRSCIYGAPQFIQEERKTAKCDFCIDLLAIGEDPSCVASCVMRAIEYGEIDDLIAKYGKNDSIRYLPDSSITGPNIIVNQKPR